MQYEHTSRTPETYVSPYQHTALCITQQINTFHWHTVLVKTLTYTAMNHVVSHS